MNCLIVLNGRKLSYKELRNISERSDYIICADGGAKRAFEAGIKIDAVIGDFDSLSESYLNLFKSTDIKIIEAPVEKDETDGVLAVDYAISEGAEDVIILGGEGGRMDHQYGNIMLLKRLQKSGISGKMILENGYVFLSNKPEEIECSIGDIISIVPFEGNLTIKNSSGLKYDIDSDTPFNYDYPVGISNVAVQDKVVLEIREGNALIFHYSAKI